MQHWGLVSQLPSYPWPRKYVSHYLSEHFIIFKHTQETNGSHDVGSINTESQQERVDGGVKRSGEGATAEKGTDTLRGRVITLDGEVVTGTSGDHAGTDEGENGESEESHIDGFEVKLMEWVEYLVCNEDVIVVEYEQ